MIYLVLYNKNLSEIDLSKSPLLEQLWIDHCAFERINLSVCPALINLNCGYNNIESLDLGANTAIKSLTVAGNPMKKLDTEKLTSLTDLNISQTPISFVNLLNAFYLQTFTAAGSQISFVDFNGTQPQRMTKVDLRDCKNFTPESMTSEAEMDEHVGVGIGEDGQHEHGGKIGKGMPFRREKRHSRHNALDALQDEGGDDGS